MSMVEKMMRVIWIDASGNRIDITRGQTGASIRRAANNFLVNEGDDTERFADWLLPDPLTGEPGALTGLKFADNVTIERGWTQIEIEEIEDPRDWSAGG